jgi:hypothetical protein
MTTSDGVSSSGLYGFKNRLINSAMVIDQRNAGASVTLSGASQYPIDRYIASLDTSATVTAQQSSTAPTGFTNSLLISVTSGTAPSAGNENRITQRIEGFNTADLGFGTATASTVTLSFWVRCSLTGTFSGSLRNSAANRSYPFTYTISTANTFEYKTITIAGDTSGTWIGATNGTGLQVTIDIGSGSTMKGTANAWASANYLGATGSTNLIATTGATFYITGVQLEKGSTATSFDYRPYGTEFQLCQRYFQTFVNNTGMANSTTGFRVPAPLQTPMRATPTVSSTGVLDINYPGVTGATQNSVGVSIDSGNANGVVVQCDNFSGLTAQRVYLLFRGSSNNSILFSSEL